jgi:hypothetical protein
VADAYQELLRDISSPGVGYLGDNIGELETVAGKPAQALTLLTSRGQVARWESEALSADKVIEKVV